jgi:hypothetical protein
MWNKHALRQTEWRRKISRQSYVGFVYALTYNNQTAVIMTFVFRLMNITIYITDWAGREL